MTYTYRRDEDGIHVLASEEGTVQPGYRRVTYSSFRRAWRLRDGVRAFGLWPINPYEAER